MKYLSSCTVIGLVLLSSLPAFSDYSAEKPQPLSAASLALQQYPEQANNTKDGGEGYEPDKVINLTVTKWINELDNSICPVSTAKSLAQKINQDAEKYKASQKSCQDREDKANKFCMESRNPDVKNYLMIAQILTGSLSGMADACSKFGQVMDAANKMLTLYQTACSSWRGVCMSACGDAVSALKSIEKNKDALVKNVVAEAKVQSAIAAKAANKATQAACDTLAASYASYVKNNSAEITAELNTDGKDYKAVAKKQETCKGYAKELASAGVGMIGVLKSFGQGNKCENQTTNVATETNVDCTVPANKQNNMQCICQDSPRTPGCNNGLDSVAAAKSGDTLRGVDPGSYTPGGGSAGNFGIDGGTDGMDLSSKSPDGGGSLPGAPSGGGSGLGGSGGGFGGGGAGDGAQAKRAGGLNTNILGGEGGGGGGGSWGGSNYDRDTALRQYLPGGAKDPAAMAGAALSKQVTSQGGRSNWEKVKDRYRDNKPSLLGY